MPWRCTIVLVTHDIDQARRVTDRLACLGLRDGVGRVVQCGPCCELLDGRTNAEVAERLGGGPPETGDDPPVPPPGGCERFRRRPVTPSRWWSGASVLTAGYNAGNLMTS